MKDQPRYPWASCDTKHAERVRQYSMNRAARGLGRRGREVAEGRKKLSCKHKRNNAPAEAAEEKKAKKKV